MMAHLTESKELAITVENVSKIFTIYDRASDRLREAFSLKRKKYHTGFTALRNISFEVKKGEFLGIVGKNGAGKSTLLKILSRELTPTTGRVLIDGKVSLLQLGVGFDPELTGIENARFASKLLGYTGTQIDAMLEDIIAFADIGDFIHHPVKTYSSGMYSRLSFAVGINIDPDILIADEVLAVGDMRFSQKCLRKMREFKERGKTVILVTHDLQSVTVFCDTTMWINDGEICEKGDAKTVATDFMNYMLYDRMPAEYHKMEKIDSKENVSAQASAASDARKGFDPDSIEWDDMSGFDSIGDGRAEIIRFAFLLKDTMKRAQLINGNEDVYVLLDILINDRIENPQAGIRINNRQGLVAVHTNNDICGAALPPLSAGDRFVVRFSLKLPSLSNGNYMFSVGFQDNDRMSQLIDDVHEFRVLRNDAKSTQCGYVIMENEEAELFFLTGR